jgi:adenosylcobinamide-GDP ribazoletransferase
MLRMSRQDLWQLLADIHAGLGLLTRIPVRVDVAAASARGARGAWAWPLVGLIVGFLATLVAALSLWLGMTAGLAAAIALAAQAMLTGALHEDGLADSLDGLWGGHTRERRLAIMKDSRIGTYGVLGLALVLLIRWQALTMLFTTGWFWAALPLVGAVSRWPMVALLEWLPPAKSDGLGQVMGRPGGWTLIGTSAVAVVTALLLGGHVALPLAIVLLCVTALWSATARARVGGHTGDILGAAQHLCETAALLTLVTNTP